MLRAEIVHSLPGRLRLRVAGTRGDAATLKQLAVSLSAYSGVDSVEIRPNIGGLVVVHKLGEAWQPMARYAAEQGLFAITAALAAAPGPSLAETTAAGLKVINRRFRRATGGSVDFQSAMFVTFLGLAAHQVRQGHYFGPATTLILSAYGFLKEKSR